MYLATTQVFRDVSAWYHIVLLVIQHKQLHQIELKLYVNGSQVTAFTTANYPSLNANLNLITRQHMDWTSGFW
jgi:hypothetical protein